MRKGFGGHGQTPLPPTVLLPYFFPSHTEAPQAINEFQLSRPLVSMQSFQLLRGVAVYFLAVQRKKQARGNLSTSQKAPVAEL